MKVRGGGSGYDLVFFTKNMIEFKDNVFEMWINRETFARIVACDGLLSLPTLSR